VLKSWRTDIPSASRTGGVSTSPPVLKDGQHHGGARVGEKHPEEDCFWRREPEGRRDDGDNPDRQADLEHPPMSIPFFISREALEREFHADGEEEEYDTEFCEDLHICSICDEAEAVGARQ